MLSNVAVVAGQRRSHVELVMSSRANVRLHDDGHGDGERFWPRFATGVSLNPEPTGRGAAKEGDKIVSSHCCLRTVWPSWGHQNGNLTAIVQGCECLIWVRNPQPE